MDFLAQHQLYIVLAIVLIIWFGLAGYLLRIDRKLSELEHSTRK